MKLVFIYGPPATGKLTVANELSKITNFEVLHNHITHDQVKQMSDYGDKTFTEILNDLRVQKLVEKFKKGIKGLIFTYCYDSKEDDIFVKKVIKEMKKINVEIFFVNLYASLEELKKRVVMDSRKKYGKIKTKEKLETVFEDWNPYDKIGYVENLSIDNSDLNPKNVSEMIRRYLKK